MAMAQNSTLIRSVAAPSGAVGDDCTHVALWDDASGTTFLGSRAISTNPSALQLGERLEIAPGALTLSQPVGDGETEALARRALAGKVSGGIYLSFHTADPTNSGSVQGTNAMISELGRVQIAQNQFTIT